MNVLDAGLYSKLNGTGAVTSLLSDPTAIYSVQAPDDAVYPYIVFNIQGGGDENLSSHRTKSLVISIRIYSVVSKAEAGSIDAAVDVALHGQSLTISGWTNLWLAREQDIELAENSPSQVIWMVGGLYRERAEKN